MAQFHGTCPPNLAEISVCHQFIAATVTQPDQRPEHLRSSAENGGTFQQTRKAVVVEIHKTILTRTYASVVKTQLRTKPAALPKNGGRSAPSAPPKGQKPKRVLRLSVPREQQKRKYQPSAGPKSRKDRRPLGNHSIVLRLWPWNLRRLYPQSRGIPPPPVAVSYMVLRALDPIHHQGLCIALGALRTSPIKSLYAEAWESSFEHRLTKLAFNYILKLK
ncbi:hypothetical protein PoB_000527100 [Plakobranchus ocellatus]|uniref:Uncharacterized protein n=1 Tax=Plakobranchus ocellatus TaxID=259542 RepID=A0AAV3Y6E2_9GAST|nr:hypothetical protein PoB_000527100 [Plakobranchus ocellatus]